MTYKIYGLAEAGTNLIKYIGLTHRTLDVRLNEHLLSSKNLKIQTLKANWIRSVNENIEIILLKDNLTRNEAFNREKEFVLKYKDNILVNGNEGGGGVLFHSDETKAKIGLSQIGHKKNLGRVRQQWEKDNISKSKIGKKPRKINYNHTNETKEKISNSCKGRASTRKGVTLSNEVKLKIQLKAKIPMTKERIQERLNDYNRLKNQEYVIKNLSLMWDIAPTNVRRFLKRYDKVCTTCKGYGVFNECTECGAVSNPIYGHD